MDWTGKKGKIQDWNPPRRKNGLFDMPCPHNTPPVLPPPWPPPLYQSKVERRFRTPKSVDSSLFPLRTTRRQYSTLILHLRAIRWHTLQCDFMSIEVHTESLTFVMKTCFCIHSAWKGSGRWFYKCLGYMVCKFVNTTKPHDDQYSDI